MEINSITHFIIGDIVSKSKISVLAHLGNLYTLYLFVGNNNIIEIELDKQPELFGRHIIIGNTAFSPDVAQEIYFKNSEWLCYKQHNKFNFYRDSAQYDHFIVNFSGSPEILKIEYAQGNYFLFEEHYGGRGMRPLIPVNYQYSPEVKIPSYFVPNCWQYYGETDKKNILLFLIYFNKKRIFPKILLLLILSYLPMR